MAGPMRWEYRTVTISRQREGMHAAEAVLTAELNRLGDEGFEAFAAVDGWHGSFLLLLFKRPAAGEIH